MDRLNPLDALFIDAEDEDPRTSMAIASIAVFEGPCPAHEEFLAFLAGRLPLVPRYRQKLRTVPLRLGRPVWVDDPHFDLGYHVRRMALPWPGGDRQLAEFMARVMSQRLDRDHPLWEYWVVEGLGEGRWALISKEHHCMVDGISAVGLYRVIFGFSPAPSVPAATDDRAPGAEPSPLKLAAEAVLDDVLLPLRGALALGSSASHPGRTIGQAADAVRAFAKLTPAAWPTARSSLSGPIGKERRFIWARASLDDVKLIEREFGGTVNDVVLAAISGGFRALLLARGEQPGPHMVRSLVPVSLRAPGEEGSYENRVSAVLADLPVHVADPVERLAAVRTGLQALKASREAMAGESLISLGRYSPYPLWSRWARLAFGLPQRQIITVTTNVPGPQQPFYGMGRRLVEIIPCAPIATTVRTGIAIFTYCGTVTFGITGDFTASPDLGVLAGGIERGLSELLAAAERHHSRAAIRYHPVIGPDGSPLVTFVPTACRS
jgi:diacylglycerol O-acyltransferase